MVERQLGRNGIDAGISIISPSTFSTNESKRVHPNDVKSATSPIRGNKILVHDDFTLFDRAVVCAGEMVGTALLMFLGCMGCISGMAGEVPAGQMSLTFGLTVMIVIQIFGHISGAHINPAVTLTAVLLGYTSLRQVPVYFIGQFAGAIGGFALLQLVTPEQYIKSSVTIINGTEYKTPGLCSPDINSQITTAQGFAVEFLSTLILVFVCCGVWDYRNKERQDSIPLKFGFAVAALSMAAGPYTGAHMNPARSFAPALLNGDWEFHWIYWAAPFSAALAGSLFYRVLFGSLPKPEEDEELREGFL